MGFRGLAIAVFLLIIGYVGYRAGQRSTPKPQPETKVEEATPNVLVAVRELSRLEGTSFHLERVVDLRDKQQLAWGMVEVEDAILLVAVGDVTAGVDLMRVAPEDIHTSGREVAVHLPRAEIFQVRVDNERSYVHTRQTDALAERRVDLETEARRRAERGFRDAALEGGILLEAERSVERTVRALFRSLGFEKVRVEFTDRELPAGR